MSNELLSALLEVFPTEGHTVPYIELKFRYAGRFGPDVLENLLNNLIEDEVLMTYEFNGSINYKSLKDLPMTSNSSGTPIKSDDMQTDLANLLKELAIRSGDPSIIDLANDFARKYS